MEVDGTRLSCPVRGGLWAHLQLFPASPRECLPRPIGHGEAGQSCEAARGLVGCAPLRSLKLWGRLSLCFG